VEESTNINTGTFCTTQREMKKLMERIILTRTRVIFKLPELKGDFDEQRI
jgi:hypothetical protein